MITVTEIKALRERTGSGIEQCKKALEVCEGNQDLAFCFLRYLGCAVYVKGMTNEEWALKKAKEDYEGEQRSFYIEALLNREFRNQR